jgi:hypothetical protein
MRMGNAQAALLSEPASAPEHVRSDATVSTVSTASDLLDDGLPPPTKSQVHYWRELAGAISVYGALGLRDDQWPADLAPSKPTLTCLQERQLVVRRRGAWHLRRHWYTRLSALRQRAVPTPPLAVAERPAPHLPAYAELETFEAICRWLDTQPKSRSRLPFVGVLALGAISEVPIEHLRMMRRYKLVRHTSRCEWALSKRWKERLQALWHGVDQALREYAPPQLASSFPTSLCAGIDTWHLNWCVQEALPRLLRTELDALQEQAREEEAEVDTPWVYDGAPLRMYRSGTRAESGGGVSWSYVLVNPSLRLLIRKAPLGGIVAQARLGSECLWRLSPRQALDQLDRLVRRLWRLGSFPRLTARQSSRGDAGGHWQVSQAHLAHDVANAPLLLDDLSRYVSRSRSQAIYEPSRQHVDDLLHDLTREEGGFDVGLPLTMDWDALYADGMGGAVGTDLGWRETGDAESRGQDALEEDVDDRAITAHTWGKRLSGITWSPGGAISFVAYDKTLEARLRNKRHMEPIWKAGGWDGRTAVTRHEARLRRDVLRALRLPNVDQPVLDDPWQFLDHLPDVWAAVVGLAGLADGSDEACPGAVDAAWIRRVVPREGETNRSRWDTDPTWRVVQAAAFTSAPAPARRMVRRVQRAHDVQQLDRSVYGCLVSRVAALHPDGSEWDISCAIGEAAAALVKESEKPGKDFGTLVRERRRERGLPLAACEKVLSLRFLAAETSDAHVPAIELIDDVPVEDGEAPTAQRRAELRVRAAHWRMRQAFLLLVQAEQRAAPTHELAALEAAYQCEVAAYETAKVHQADV